MPYLAPLGTLADVNPLPLLLVGAGLLLLAKKPGAKGGSVTPSKPGKLPDNYVWFNEDFTQYEISTGWRIRVLDGWLEEQYDQGRIVTIHNPDSADEWEGDPSWYLGYGRPASALLLGGLEFLKLSPYGRVIAWGGRILLLMTAYATDEQFASAIHKEAVEATGMGALSEFMRTHQVFYGPQNKAILISDLPDTPAVEAFVDQIADYVGRFQASDMESI